MALRRLGFLALLAARAALPTLALQWEARQTLAPAGLALGRSSAAKFRQELQNQGGAGMAYTASITVGGQAIQGVLDTGSYELLVFSTSCRTCGDVSKFYNDSRSRSHERGHLRSSHTFGSGTTRSRLAFEDVVIGPLHSDRQYFWEVVGADLPVAHGGGFQAIVGVGPPSTPRADSLAQAERAEALRRRVKANPTLRAREGAKAAARDAISLAEEPTLLEQFGVLSFSICVRREEGSGGYFVWNDEASRQKQPPGLFTPVPVVGNLTWGVRLANVRMQVAGSLKPVDIGCEGGCGALVDSGTSLLVLPTEAARVALDAISMLHTDCSNLDSLPELHFELGGGSFSLPPRAYVGRTEGRLPELVERYAAKADPGPTAACELLVMTMDVRTQLGPMWILGLPFFREYYTTFSLGTGIWDEADRSLFIAEADEDCQPQPPKTGRSLAQRVVRSVNLSKVRLPHWATAAASAGTVML